jgi:hypothetical protein
LFEDRLEMNPQLLIDPIVRQTMVLIAQLSTVDGVRSPLSHVADEVFVNLVRELESQGVGKKVIADMFGLALRSYRQKVQRLRESVTTRGVTLWGAVHAFLAERESATRAEILAHFKHDEEATLRSILNDLVESGLVLRSGRGRDTRYRTATPRSSRSSAPPPAPTRWRRTRRSSGCTCTARAPCARISSERSSRCGRPRWRRRWRASSPTSGSAWRRARTASIA